MKILQVLHFYKKLRILKVLQVLCFYLKNLGNENYSGFCREMVNHFFKNREKVSYQLIKICLKLKFLRKLHIKKWEVFSNFWRNQDSESKFDYYFWSKYLLLLKKISKILLFLLLFSQVLMRMAIFNLMCAYIFVSKSRERRS